MKDFHQFPCGDVSLDFLGTRRRRLDPEPLELLSSPAMIGAWFRESGLVDGDVAFQPSDVDDAIAVREAIHSLMTASMARAGFDDKALALVNATAAGAPITTTLTASGRRTEATPAQALASVARDAVAILTGDDRSLLKQCNNEGCTQVYVDHSRAGNREWCSMEPCGNRIKARAYRARKSASAA